MKCPKNYKKTIFGNCKRKYSSNSPRKSYNPFKMWGSWICAILVFLGLFYIFSALRCFISCLSWSSHISNNLDFFYMTLPIGVIIGFLIGWGINSLWRKFRK
jgi:F0F1-type ATP synthase assembly protein I